MFLESYFKMFFLVFILLFCDVHSLAILDRCDAIPASLTAPKTGQKAWDKCIEYQERFVYPCEDSPQPGGTPQRGDYCTLEPLVLNNTDTADNEYNYVVSLAYGNETNIYFFVGGTIISEKYILTVAHSTYAARSEPHSVYLGPPVGNAYIDRSRLYKIKRIIQHPDHKPYIFYHNIALIETEELMKLNKYIRPACLHTGEPLNYDEATLLSRNFLGYPTTPFLSKLKERKLSIEECSKEFSSSQNLSLGYVDEFLMCYQDNNWPYRHDSGCPLQVKSDKINCMDVVIGVSSAVKLRPPSRLLFTRVSYYLPWIESIVWP